MFSFFSNANSNYDQLAHEVSFNSIDGKTINLKDYKEKVENLINTEFELDQKRKEALTKYNDVKNAEIIVSALF